MAKAYVFPGMVIAAALSAVVTLAVTPMAQPKPGEECAAQMPTEIDIPASKLVNPADRDTIPVEIVYANDGTSNLPTEVLIYACPTGKEGVKSSSASEQERILLKRMILFSLPREGETRNLIVQLPVEQTQLVKSGVTLSVEAANSELPDIPKIRLISADPIM